MNLVIANRQRRKKINSRRLREITEALLAELKITDAELGINLVGAREMALVNETFLQHEGATDVITFNHGEAGTPRGGVRTAQRAVPTIHGELFICVDVAVAQAKEFKSSWQTEVVRYVLHGVLHLLGYDDLKPALRREMKREENRLVRRLEKRFSLAQVSRTVKINA
jgi:probable rRNA maturation factor